MYDDEEKPDLDKEIRSKKATTKQDNANGETSDTGSRIQAIVASMVGFWTDELTRAYARSADPAVVNIYRDELAKWTRKFEEGSIRGFKEENGNC